MYLYVQVRQCAFQVETTKSLISGNLYAFILIHQLNTVDNNNFNF